jgi:hypothetical protein
MNVLHPGIALAGVAAVALPIIIHLLFRRRRIPLDWAAMDLLREAVRRTNRRLKLEQWTVLALRALAVLLAGLGLSVPFVGDAGLLADVSRTWIVVLDDGATSGVRVGSEPELARLKDEAARLVAERGPRDRVGIVLASTPPRLLLAPTGDLAQFERELEAVTPSETPSDLRGAVLLARGAIEGDGPRGAAGDGRIVIASAFRTGSIEAGTSQPTADGGGTRDRSAADATKIIAPLPARDAPVDVRVSRIEARPAPTGGTVAVRATLARQGGSLEEQSTDVRASGDGFAPSPARRVSWERGQSEAFVEFQLSPVAAGTSDVRRASIEVSVGDDALQVGNSAWTVVDVRSDVDVGVIGRRGTLDVSDLEKVPASLWVSRALSPSVGSGMLVREIDPSTCDARALVGLDAVVVTRPDLLSQQSCDALGEFVRGGGIAIVIPAGEARVQAWATMLLPRLGVTMTVDPEASILANPATLAEEQPAARILASIRPELPALVAPISATKVSVIRQFDAADVVLAFSDGSPFVAAQMPRLSDSSPAEGGPGVGSPSSTPERGQGLVVLFASAPELGWTNLPVKPLMVPLFQEIVRTAIQLSASREQVVVGERVRAIPGLRMRGPAGSTIVIEQDGMSAEAVRASGMLRGEDGTLIAVNARESSLGLLPVTEDAVRAALRGTGTIAFRSLEKPTADGAAPGAGETRGEEREAQRSRIAFLVLVLALAALLFEGFLSRVFSHASLARSGTNTELVSTIGRVRPRGSGAARTAVGQAEPAGGRR